MSSPSAHAYVAPTTTPRIASSLLILYAREDVVSERPRIRRTHDHAEYRSCQHLHGGVTDVLAQRPGLDLVEEILEAPLEAVLNALAGVRLVAPAAPAPEQPVRLACVSTGVPS